MAKKKSSSQEDLVEAESDLGHQKLVRSQQQLIICRNKHWRYISAFHGPWLQLPPEVIETLANINYNTPRPRPIDPAVFFDLVKIRRLVDEAIDLAVRAASGVASLNQQSIPGLHHAAALGLGFGFRPGNQAKLSPERKHRMRKDATHKLCKAYKLDEVACSVSTMQSASALEEVASLVLQRSPDDSDAKYVHFFHEKIPSRQLAECTSLQPLDEAIHENPSDPEPLRTRGIVKIFKEDFQGAVADFTDALRVHRLRRPTHRYAGKDAEAEQQVAQRTARRTEDVVLKEEEQPSSLETQLLFQRAGVYLTMACQHVDAAFPDGSPQVPEPDSDGDQASPPLSPEVLEARQHVRQNAKRALRDYMTYLSHFEYSPDLPLDIAEDFARKVNSIANGVRVPRHTTKSASPLGNDERTTQKPHRIYVLSDLFAPSPPPDLPPYPITDLASLQAQQPPPPVLSPVITETLTYHPLLADALHALLLCHCLIQTSAKELLRHAYMVARLARLADGYPAFQASRSPARTDWVEVLRAGGNWIQLAGAWDDLCAPAPVPVLHPNGSSPLHHLQHQPPQSKPALPSSDTTGSEVSTELRELPSPFPFPVPVETEKQRKDRLHHQIVLDALGDERVSDEPSFRQAVLARQLRAEHDYQLANAVAELRAQITSGVVAGQPQQPQQPQQPPQQQQLLLPANNHDNEDDDGSSLEGAIGDLDIDGQKVTSDGNGGVVARAQGNGNGGGPGRHELEKEYPVGSDRALAVARWVLDAPPNAGIVPGDGKKRRKRTVKKVAAHAAAAPGGEAEKV
ncbi:hypothetical protein QC761_300770 [Podospora bellae-mahoneyi]|uniref:Histidine kinase group protein n=1 Tax=Podospora bellae-mahoneyi TaxID=2093777 RepID=A0ABR0FJ56_9PEZI|nr:hypothetical protein QC761_300770 [Podospora bellae-mahoneyi]